MRLLHPWALLLVLPFLWRALRRLRHARQHPGAPFSSLAIFSRLSSTPRQRFVRLPLLLETLAAILLVLALARPQSESETRGLPKEGIAIELAVDVSSSMDIAMPFEGRSRSRMKITRDVVERFVAGGDELPGRPDDLVGLVTFARYADTVCPLTLDHETLLYFIRNLQVETRPNEDGTAFGDAVALAAARLRTAERRYGQTNAPVAYRIQSKVVVLLTDGNNNCGKLLPMEAAALAKKWGVRIHAVAILDPPEKKTVQTPDGPVEIEADPPIQERILRKMAETTGGIYRRASDAASLVEIYREIDRMEKSRLDVERYRVWTDRFSLPALAALLLLLLRVLLSATWLRTAP